MLHISPTERAVLQLVADGNATTAIADRLGISERAVEALLSPLFERMGAASPREAIAAALRRGLLKDTGRQNEFRTPEEAGPPLAAV